MAGEVKSLSRQTSDATETIKSQIQQLTSSFADVLGSVSNAQNIVHNVMKKLKKFLMILIRSTRIRPPLPRSDRAGQHYFATKIAVQLLAENMAVVKDKGDINLHAVDVLADQTDKSVKLIEDWRVKLANEDIEDKVLYLAQADHLLWKKRLLDMAVGKSQMKSTDLTDHTLCRLGKWYYSDASARLKIYRILCPSKPP